MTDGILYNQLDNVDSLQERIIFLLFNEGEKDSKEIERTHNLRRLLLIDEGDCLFRDTPSWDAIRRVIDDDGTRQDDKRIFRYPYVEQTALAAMTSFRIYVEEILPVDVYKAYVNVSIDILSHGKNLNIRNPLYHDDEKTPLNPTEFNPIVQYKSRLEMLETLTIQLLNGKEVGGIGPLVFSRENNKFVRSKIGLWNNRQFVGKKVVMTAMFGINYDNVA